MQERLTNPAPELLEISEPKKTIPEHYLEYLTRNQGILCTTEELLEFYRSLSNAKAATLRAIRWGLSVLRTQLISERQRVVTIFSHTERIHGVVLLPKDRKVTSLSQIGVSVFRDEPGELRVVPLLSVLSKKKLKQNPLVEPGVVISLFDALDEEDEKTHHQSPLLSPTQRRLIAFLAEHPEGISARELLGGLGIKIKHVDQTDYKLIETHLSRCRAKMKNGLQIYYAPTYSREETKYFLVDKRRIGEKIYVPIVGEDKLASFPEPARKTVDNLCNRLTVQTETKLKSLITPTQRRLLLYLAHHFGSLCSTKELINCVLGRTEVFPSDFVNIRLVKRALQRALQENELSIFTIPKGFDKQKGAYVLLPKNHFQERERGEVTIVTLTELMDVDEKIQASVQKICNQVRVKGLNLYPMLGGKMREAFLALAKSFPEGRKIRALSEELYPEYVLPGWLLKPHIHCLRKTLLKEFGDEGISIRTVQRTYIIEVPEKNVTVM